MDGRSNRLAVGISVLVAWFAVPAVAAIVLVAGLPEAQPADCTGWCYTTQETGWFMLMFVALPFGVASVAMAGLFYGLVGRRIPGGVVAGTVSAWAGMLLAFLGSRLF